MGSPGIGQFVTDCGGGVWVNSNTSCPFAQNVHEQWMLDNPKGGWRPICGVKVV